MIVPPGGAKFIGGCISKTELDERALYIEETHTETLNLLLNINNYGFNTFF